MDADNRLVFEQLQQLLRAFQTAGRAILPDSNDELLETVVEAAARIFGAAAASIALVDEAAGQLVFRVSYGAGRDQVVGMRIPLDTGIAGYVAITGEPLTVSNVRQDPRFAESAAASTGYVPQSILAMPLLYHERVIGVIEVLDKLSAPSFGMQDMELLSLFARQAAVAIHQSEQFDLLGLGLLHCIDRVVSTNDLPALHDKFCEILADLDREAISPDRSLHELIELADLFHALGQLGQAERDAARQVLSAFGDYARRERLPG